MTFQPKLHAEDVIERSNSPLIPATNLVIPEIPSVMEQYHINDLYQAVQEEALDKIAMILGQIK